MSSAGPSSENRRSLLFSTNNETRVALGPEGEISIAGYSRRAVDNNVGIATEFTNGHKFDADVSGAARRAVLA